MKRPLRPVAASTRRMQPQSIFSNKFERSVSKPGHYHSKGHNSLNKLHAAEDIQAEDSAMEGNSHSPGFKYTYWGTFYNPRYMRPTTS